MLTAPAWIPLGVIAYLMIHAAAMMRDMVYAPFIWIVKGELPRDWSWSERLTYSSIMRDCDPDDESEENKDADIHD